MKWLVGGLLLLLVLGGGVYLRLYPSGTAVLPEAGALVTQSHLIAAYDSLVIDGPFEVTLAAGAPALTLTAEAAVQSAFAADQRGGVLRFYLTAPVESGAAPRIALAGQAVKNIELLGSARLDATGGAAPEVTLAAHDAARAVLSFICTSAKLLADGAAEIAAGGLRCERVEVAAADAARIEGRK